MNRQEDQPVRPAVHRLADEIPTFKWLNSRMRTRGVDLNQIKSTEDLLSQLKSSGLSEKKALMYSKKYDNIEFLEYHLSDYPLEMIEKLMEN